MLQVEICFLNLLFITQILGWTRFCSVNTEQNLVPTQILVHYLIGQTIVLYIIAFFEPFKSLKFMDHMLSLKDGKSQK